jgi:hypothetical protein
VAGSCGFRNRTPGHCAGTSSQGAPGYRSGAGRRSDLLSHGPPQGVAGIAVAFAVSHMRVCGHDNSVAGRCRVDRRRRCAPTSRYFRILRLGTRSSMVSRLGRWARFGGGSGPPTGRPAHPSPRAPYDADADQPPPPHANPPHHPSQPPPLPWVKLTHTRASPTPGRSGRPRSFTASGSAEARPLRWCVPMWLRQHVRWLQAQVLGRGCSLVGGHRCGSPPLAAVVMRFRLRR